MSVIRNPKHGGHVFGDAEAKTLGGVGGAADAAEAAGAAGGGAAGGGAGGASRAGGAGGAAGAETGSMIRNTAHDAHIASILEMALLQGGHSDVTLSVQGSRRVIRCHKSVLAQASPFLASLLSSLDPQDPAHIYLAGLSFTEAMAMLNLVYVGRVKLASDLQVTSTISAAKSFLGLTVEASPPSLPPRPRKRPLPHRPTPSKRPLLIKAAPGSAPPPVFFVVAPAPPVQGEKVHTSRTGQEAVMPPLDDSEVDFSSLNSYQKAKLRCADKFKCDQCGKGFPLSCLLQRHKKTHSDVKPHGCTYCDKTFSSKTSLNHHMFMQHLEEKSKRLEEGKRLLERLRKVEEAKYTLLGGDGQVMKALTEGGEYILSDREGDGQGKSVEIIGVQDITQQIAVQMEGQQQGGRDTVIQVEDGKYTLLGSLLPHQQQKPKFPGENIYYSEPEAGGYTWEYKT